MTILDIIKKSSSIYNRLKKENLVPNFNQPATETLASLAETFRVLDQTFSVEHTRLHRNFNGYDVAKSLTLQAREKGVTLFYVEHEILLEDSEIFFKDQKLLTGYNVVIDWIYNQPCNREMPTKSFFETNIPPDWARSLQEKGKWNLYWIGHYKEHGELPL